jgi:hypothetical protein
MRAILDHVDDVLSVRALSRATLERQMLLRRVNRPVPEAIEALVGLQAQNPGDPYVGLWSRLQGFSPDELAQGLLDRSAVRASLMRGTIHLVSATDFLKLRPVMQPVLERSLFSTGYFGRHLKGMDIEGLVAAARLALQERPRTRAELRLLLGEQWPDRDAETMALAVTYLVPLVQATPRGVWGKTGQARWARAEDWLGNQGFHGASIDEVVLRYLSAFGPATVMDIQSWCGLTRLREVTDRLRPNLRVFRDESGRELFDLPEGSRPDPEVPAPVRFLPQYDNVFLSHADRSRVSSEKFGDLMWEAWQRSESSSFKPISWSMFMIDGFLAGTWKIDIDKGRGSAMLSLQPVGELSKTEAADLSEEGMALLAFLAPDAKTYDVGFVTLEGSPRAARESSRHQGRST